MSILKLAGGFARGLIRAFSMEDPAQPLLPMDAMSESLGLGRSDAGVMINEKQAMRLSVAFGCIKVISQDLSRLPFEIFQSMPDGSLRVATEHKYYSLLHDRPNPQMSSQVWRMTMHASCCAWGNGYSWIKRDKAGRPVALVPLAAGKTSPVNAKTKDGGVHFCFATTQSLGGQTEFIEPEDVLHFMDFTLDGFKGMSPIQTCKNAFGLGIAAEKFGAQFFGQGARATGVFTHPDHLEGEAYENFKKSLYERLTGDQALRPLVLEEGMKWQQLTIPPNDAQFLECVTPETRLSMADGTHRKAKDVRSGDVVLSWNEAEDRIVNGVVKNIGRPPLKPLVRVTTERGREIECSADHPFLTRDVNQFCWIAANGLRLGDRLRNVSGWGDCVSSVEPISDAGRTVGIEIEGFNNHVTGGIVTHNTRKFQKEEVACLYRVPMHLLQDLQRATNNNIEHQGLDYVRFCLAPRAVNMEQEISYKLLGSTSYICEHNFMDLQRGDFASQTTGLATLRNAGIFSVNRCLRQMREAPVPTEEGGDLLIVNGTYVSLASLTGEQEPDSPATGTGAEPDTDPGDPAARSRTQIANAFLPLFRDATGRVLHRIEKDGYSQKTRELVSRSFAEPVRAMQKAILASRYGNDKLTEEDTLKASRVISKIEHALVIDTGNMPSREEIASTLVALVFDALTGIGQ